MTSPELHQQLIFVTFLFYASAALAFFFCSTLRSNARLICGKTPPKAMVALMRVSSSSSPRMAS